MSNQLTKPLVVPEFGNPNANTQAKVKLYVNDAQGNAVEQPNFTINIQTILNNLFPGQGRIACPNACALLQDDLFVSVSSSNSQAVIKFTNYLNDPTKAQNEAFIFTLDGNDYVGSTFDSNGNLFVAEGSFGNNQIIRYSGTGNTFNNATKNVNNYTPNTKVFLGNANMTSYFGNLAFDKTGNLWVSDYLNNRVVVFIGGTATYKVIGNAGTANNMLFAKPEGIAFDTDDNLWVANNNDNKSNSSTSIVKIIKPFLSRILNTEAPSSTTAPTIGTDCTIYNAPNNIPQFGGLQIDAVGKRLYINEQVAGNGVYADIDSNDDISLSPLKRLSIVSTNPGNGGIALANPNLNSHLFSKADLYIEDTSYLLNSGIDTGTEPNTITTEQHAWESKEIWITSNQNGNTNEYVKGNADCFVRVRIKNRGLASSIGTEQITLYWAKASGSLGWPAPWTNGNKYGAMVGVQNIPPVAANSESIISFSFHTPNPKDYEAEFGVMEDHHFCLLARISNVGMTFTELIGNDTALKANVLNNNNIAWRNIGIDDPAIGGNVNPFKAIIATNYSKEKITNRIEFEILNAHGQPIKDTEGKIVINLLPAALEKLRSTNFNHYNFEQAEHDNRYALLNIVKTTAFLVKDWKDGLSNLILEPQEEFYFTIQFVPNKPMEGYMLRTIHHAQRYEIIGGQTFIHGKVNRRPSHSKLNLNTNKK